jgi:gluconokinase
MVRAGLEAVAYRLAQVLELLLPQLPADPQLVASGGALLRSPVWLQILADVTGRLIAVSGVPEASGRGAALLALEALGAIRQVSDVPAYVGRQYTPDPAQHAVYQAAMQRQQALYTALIRQ